MIKYESIYYALINDERKLIMSQIQEVSIQNISPYIRYVNHLCCPTQELHVNRILYDYEFIFCLDGKATMHYDGNTYLITRGDIFYIKPHLYNQLIIEKDNFFYAHCVHFDWVLIDDQFNFTVEETYMNLKKLKESPLFVKKLTERPLFGVSDFYIPTLIKRLDYDIISPLFKELFHTFQQDNLSSRLKERAIFMNIIAHILQSLLTDQGVNRNHYHQTTISNAIRYMQQHYMEDVTTTSLSITAGLSPKYFGNLFKRTTGKAVHEYLLDIRILNAKLFLHESELNINKISEKVGIPDVFYFTKLFKKHEGITPSVYRRMLKTIIKKEDI